MLNAVEAALGVDPEAPDGSRRRDDDGIRVTEHVDRGPPARGRNRLGAGLRIGDGAHPATPSPVKNQPTSPLKPSGAHTSGSQRLGTGSLFATLEAAEAAAAHALDRLSIASAAMEHSGVHHEVTPTMGRSSDGRRSSASGSMHTSLSLRLHPLRRLAGLSQSHGAGGSIGPGSASTATSPAARLQVQVGGAGHQQPMSARSSLLSARTATAPQVEAGPGSPAAPPSTAAAFSGAVASAATGARGSTDAARGLANQGRHQLGPGPQPRTGAAATTPSRLAAARFSSGSSSSSGLRSAATSSHHDVSSLHGTSTPSPAPAVLLVGADAGAGADAAPRPQDRARLFGFPSQDSSDSQACDSPDADHDHDGASGSAGGMTKAPQAAASVTVSQAQQQLHEAVRRAETAEADAAAAQAAAAAASAELSAARAEAELWRSEAQQQKAASDEQQLQREALVEAAQTAAEAQQRAEATAAEAEAAASEIGRELFEARRKLAAVAARAEGLLLQSETLTERLKAAEAEAGEARSKEATALSKATHEAEQAAAVRAERDKAIASAAALRAKLEARQAEAAAAATAHDRAMQTQRLSHIAAMEAAATAHAEELASLQAAHAAAMKAAEVAQTAATAASDRIAALAAERLRSEATLTSEIAAQRARADAAEHAAAASSAAAAEASARSAAAESACRKAQSALQSMESRALAAEDQQVTLRAAANEMRRAAEAARAKAASLASDLRVALQRNMRLNGICPKCSAALVPVHAQASPAPPHHHGQGDAAALPASFQMSSRGLVVSDGNDAAGTTGPPQAQSAPLAESTPLAGATEVAESTPLAGASEVAGIASGSTYSTCDSASYAMRAGPPSLAGPASRQQPGRHDGCAAEDHHDHEHAAGESLVSPHLLRTATAVAAGRRVAAFLPCVTSRRRAEEADGSFARAAASWPGRLRSQSETEHYDHHGPYSGLAVPQTQSRKHRVATARLSVTQSEGTHASQDTVTVTVTSHPSRSAPFASPPASTSHEHDASVTGTGSRHYGSGVSTTAGAALPQAAVPRTLAASGAPSGRALFRGSTTSPSPVPSPSSSVAASSPSSCTPSCLPRLQADSSATGSAAQTASAQATVAVAEVVGLPASCSSGVSAAELRVAVLRSESELKRVQAAASSSFAALEAGRVERKALSHRVDELQAKLMAARTRLHSLHRDARVASQQRDTALAAAQSLQRAGIELWRGQLRTVRVLAEQLASTGLGLGGDSQVWVDEEALTLPPAFSTPLRQWKGLGTAVKQAARADPKAWVQAQAQAQAGLSQAEHFEPGPDAAESVAVPELGISDGTYPYPYSLHIASADTRHSAFEVMMAPSSASSLIHADSAAVSAAAPRAKAQGDSALIPTTTSCYQWSEEDHGDSEDNSEAAADAPDAQVQASGFVSNEACQCAPLCAISSGPKESEEALDELCGSAEAKAKADAVAKRGWAKPEPEPLIAIPDCEPSVQQLPVRSASETGSGLRAARASAVRLTIFPLNMFRDVLLPAQLHAVTPELTHGRTHLPVHPSRQEPRISVSPFKLQLQGIRAETHPLALAGADSASGEAEYQCAGSIMMALAASDAASTSASTAPSHSPPAPQAPSQVAPSQPRGVSGGATSMSLLSRARSRLATASSARSNTAESPPCRSAGDGSPSISSSSSSRPSETVSGYQVVAVAGAPSASSASPGDSADTSSNEAVAVPGLYASSMAAHASSSEVLLACPASPFIDASAVHQQLTDAAALQGDYGY